MASLCFLVINATGAPMASISSSSSSNRLRCNLSFVNPMRQHPKTGRSSQVVCMAPYLERIIQRSPGDFPAEWERESPLKRESGFIEFSPLKTPMPMPMPEDPPRVDEEEYETVYEEHLKQDSAGQP